MWNGMFLNSTLFSDIAECASTPCKYGGSCKDLENGYKCNCMSGYDGDNCELSKYTIYHIL